MWKNSEVEDLAAPSIRMPYREKETEEQHAIILASRSLTGGAGASAHCRGWSGREIRNTRD